MAERVLEINEVLNFILSKYGKLPEKLLKQVVKDFYPLAEITNAKDAILKCLDNCNLEKIPRFPCRVKDAMMNLDDIFQIISILDEKGMLEKNSVFVSKNLNNLPPIRLEEGEYRLMVNKMEKLEEIMENQKREFSAFFKQVVNHVARCSENLSMVADVCTQLKTNISDVEAGLLTLATSINKLSTENVKTYTHIRAACTLMNESKTRSWADRVEIPFSASSIESGNHFDFDQHNMKVVGNLNDGSHISSDRLENIVDQFLTHENRNQIPSSGDKNGDLRNRFSTVVSRRNKRKLQKSQDGAQVELFDIPGGPAPKKQVTQRKEAFFGKSKTDLCIKAAKSLTPREFFYVGNVSTCKLKTFKDYLKNKNIEFVSCFPVVKKTGNLPITNNALNNKDQNRDEESANAFRVCIKSEDRSAFLDLNSWPEHILIREWTFKDKNQKSKPQADVAMKIGENSLNGRLVNSIPVDNSSPVIVTAEIH